jgi:hypothetical protein
LIKAPGELRERPQDLGDIASAATRWVVGCLAAACVCVRPRRHGSGGYRRVGWQPLGFMVLASCEASGVAAFRAEQFSVRVDDEVLGDLRARIQPVPSGQLAHTVHEAVLLAMWWPSGHYRQAVQACGGGRPLAHPRHLPSMPGPS